MSVVLIIESEIPRMRLMGWGLIEEGFDVVVVRKMRDAPARASKLAAGVVILNISGDDEGKRACVAALKRVSPASRVIDVRGDANEDTGADAYVREPVRIDDLAERIRTWMA